MTWRIFKPAPTPIERLEEAASEAWKRYIEIVNAQSGQLTCSSICVRLNRQKRKARLDWLIARLAYLEALSEQKTYST